MADHEQPLSTGDLPRRSHGQWRAPDRGTVQADERPIGAGLGQAPPGEAARQHIHRPA